MVGKAARGEFAIVSSATLPRFEDLYDRTISLIEVIDTHREEIHDIGDILINVQTLTTNNIIRVLTIISAIFLPLTLIAGIYGRTLDADSWCLAAITLWILRHDCFDAWCCSGADCCLQEKRLALIKCKTIIGMHDAGNMRPIRRPPSDRKVEQKVKISGPKH